MQYFFVLLCLASIVVVLLSEFNIKASITWYDDFENGGEIGKAKQIAKHELYRNISFFLSLVFGFLAYLAKSLRK